MGYRYKMFKQVVVGLSAIFVLANAQHKGEMTPEEVPPMTYETCKTDGGCTVQQGGITMDENWRWTHIAAEGNYTNCYTGNLWDPTICPDAATCTENCALDGIDAATWNGTYGVNMIGDNGLSLTFVTEGPYSRNVGSRTFLLDESLQSYVKFQLLNQEFTFDVDVSQLPCGLNGALYFSEMDADGGMSYDTNECGAAFGTGYCDAQCPHDMKWISGEANCEEWNPSDSDETPELVILDHAVLKWTSGKLTVSPKPTLPTLAPSKMLTSVKELNAVTMLLAKDTTESATRTDAILAHGVWETTNTTDLDLNSRLIPPNRSPL